MPTVMPTHVTKGRLLGLIDNYLSTRDEAGVGRLQADLQKPLLPLHRILRNAFPSGPSTDLNHFEDHWCPDQTATPPSYPEKLERAWWMECQPIEVILRAGLLQLCELLLADFKVTLKPKNARPVDCFWVCAGHEVQLILCPNPRQITLLFLTPMPPIVSRIPLHPATVEDIYVARHTSLTIQEKLQPKPNGVDPHVEIVRPLREP